MFSLFILYLRNILNLSINIMKNIILITFCSLLMCSCFFLPKKSPEQSVAKDSSWDYWLIGSWHYQDANEGEQSAWPEGISFVIN